MIQSPNDKRQYHPLELTNGLRVLLVRDDTAEKAAAALAVNVGHFDDPVSRQGMAHFLEHMLFLGTEKYPKIGEFQAFINRHGGSNNAWTGTEFTNYYFDIDNRQLTEGLDRFAQFFIAPLFDPGLVDKERQAVDSEYRLKLNDDTRRQHQVHKATVNPHHPFAKFSVGNLETLEDRANQPIRDELTAFYQQQYCASRMTLVVLANRPLEELEELVRHCFAAIPCRNGAKPAVTVPLYRPEDLGVRIEIQPLKEQRKLFISFSLQAIDAYYRQKPLTFLAYLIGYEGPDSLLTYLKQEGLANTLSAGGGISGSNFKDFNIGLQLTEAGVGQVDTIVEAVFAYLRLIRLRGIEAWRYDEKQRLLQLAFDFQEAQRPIDLVGHLAINMHHYPLEDVLWGDYCMQPFDQALIEHFLDALTPQNMRLTLLAPGLECDTLEPWYHCMYRISPFTDAQLARWSTPAPHPNFALAEVNPYIPSRPRPKPLPSPAPEQPRILLEDPGFRLWHLQDARFHIPKGHLFIAVDSEWAVAEERNIALTRLVIELFTDHLSESTYQAELAGLSYNIYAHQGGFTTHLSGYTEKQFLLLKHILASRKFGHFNVRRFEQIKGQLLRNWRNSLKARPISQLFSQMTALLQPNNPPVEVLIPYLEAVTPDELPDFVEALYKEIHIEVLAHGNWQQPEVLELADYLRKELAPRSTASQETRRILANICDRRTLRLEVECNHRESALISYYQSTSQEPRQLALFTLANHIMGPTFFHELRTNQQLGYVVGTGNLPLNRHPGLMLYVQSPVAGPVQLAEAIDDFLDLFPLTVLELSEAQWQASKNGLLAQIREPEANLRSRSQRLWTSIGNKDWQFDQRQQVSDAIEQLSRSELIQFLMELQHRHTDRLLVCSYGDHHHNLGRLEEGDLIEDRHQFQRNIPLFVC